MGSPARKIRVESESQLRDHIATFFYDPVGYIYYAFPWLEMDTVLQDHSGPDKWQIETLDELGRECMRTDLETAVKMAIASGHGTGKTALIAWIILWFISTRPHPQIVATANTGEQLTNKTWRELAKWHKLAINGHWFEHTATKFYHKLAPETWFASAVKWSKERSEAFAGTHEDHVLMLFDEASLIDDVIWEVAEGAMTTGSCVWLVLGNPTRNTGRFKQCFGRFRKYWKRRQIDARSAKVSNKAQIEEQIEAYGEDSDFVRVRVRGVFPRASDVQFIPSDLIDTAAGKFIEPRNYLHAPKVLGCDVAWEGDDFYTIYLRQGLNVERLGKWQHFPNETMTFASMINSSANKHDVDAIFLDVVGVGAGVYDRLIQLGRDDVIPVNAGSKAASNQFANKRMEMWWRVREHLINGGSIPDIQELKDDLEGPEYGYTGKGNMMQLEKKRHMKERGLASPDDGDGLALTFAEDIIPKRDKDIRGQWQDHRPQRTDDEYEIFG